MRALNPRHSVDHYHRLIMQDSRLKSKTRSATRWNAFLSIEMERRNTGTLLNPAQLLLYLQLTREDVAEGDDRKRVSEDNIATELSAKWNAMSAEEKIAMTEERYQELLARRETKNAPLRTTTVQAFNDTRATIARVEGEVSYCPAPRYLIDTSLLPAQGPPHAHAD